MTNVSHGLSQSKGTTVALALGQPHHRTFLHLNRNQQESRVAAIGINTCTDLCLFPLFAWERSILHIVSLMNAAYDSWIGTFHDFSSSNLRILTHCWEQSTVRQTDYRKIYSHGFLINTFLETKILSRSYSRGLNYSEAKGISDSSHSMTSMRLLAVCLPHRVLSFCFPLFGIYQHFFLSP